MSRDPHSASSRLLDLLCVIVLGLLLAFLAGAIARATPNPAQGQEAAHGAQRSIHPIHAAGTSAADCATAAKPDAPSVAGGPETRGGLPASMSLAPCADGSTTGTPAASTTSGDQAGGHAEATTSGTGTGSAAGSGSGSGAGASAPDTHAAGPGAAPAPHP